MYASELVVGGRSRAAIDDALRIALPSLGIDIRDTMDVANVSELWERSEGKTTVAFGAIGDAIYAVSVRGPRAPAWNNELARRLSQLLGGWAACFVNDRLLDDYGYGYFLDGMTIETAICAGRSVVERLGYLPEVPDRLVLDVLDEERNLRNFRNALESLAGPYVSSWPPSGAIRAFVVEGDAITVTELARPPSTLLFVAGHPERIGIPGYEYDLVLDGGEEVSVLLARTSLPTWEIVELVDRVECVAFFTNGTETFVRSGAECAPAAFANLRTALDAWEPISAITRTAPMYFTFDAVRATSPWR